MSRWVLPTAPISKPGVGADDLDVGVALGHQHPDRIERAVGEEDGERRGPRHEPDGGQPGGGADQVLLGDAHLEEPVRMGLGELVRLGRVGQIAVEDDRTRIGVAELDQLLAPHIAHRGHAVTPFSALLRVVGLCVGIEQVDLVGIELLSSLLEVLLRRDDAVPGVHALGQGQALALDRVGDEHGRPTVEVAGPGQLVGAGDLVVVVAVDLDRPATRRPGRPRRGRRRTRGRAGHRGRCWWSRWSTAGRTAAARCGRRSRSGW